MGEDEHLLDLAREDLQSALRQARESGLGALEACHGSLARSAERLEAAVSRFAADPTSRGPAAVRSLDRFQRELRIYSALHRAAGTISAEWARALGGPGGQAYSPKGGGIPVRGGRCVSVEA